MTMLAKLEEQKADLIRSLGEWPAEQLLYRPTADGWTATEVVDHIVKVEEGIGAAARRGLDNPHPVTMLDQAGFAMLKRVFQSKMRVKVPGSARNVLPARGVTLGPVLERWDLSRIELSHWIAGVSPDQTNVGLFRHPVSGWMNLQQVLEFFSVHIDHHHFQLARLRRASRVVL